MAVLVKGEMQYWVWLSREGVLAGLMIEKFCLMRRQGEEGGRGHVHSEAA
jgi:hypothetical protein